MAKYTRNIWYDKSDSANAIPINHTHLNNMEEGIQKSFEEIAYANLKNLVVQKIASSCEWTAPKAVKNMFKIFCVGGGGGGGLCSADSYSMFGGGGGGGGQVSIDEFEILEGTSVSVICGAGGNAGENGGVTSFGDYISSLGGDAGGNGDSVNRVCGDGGAGGSGGGGGGALVYRDMKVKVGSGGRGYTYGGGGAGGYYYSSCTPTLDNMPVGGSSGSLGGNGGTPGVIPKSGQFVNDSFLNCLFDRNFIFSINQSPSEGSGDGGVGSNGGSAMLSAILYEDILRASGGGGGYCGNGGNGGGYNTYGGNGGGGGGGFCGNGGDGLVYSSGAYPCGGGGGGFFCNGGNGEDETGGGGGGFFCDGNAGRSSRYGCTSDGKGGNGGVLIMYVKEEE